MTRSSKIVPLINNFVVISVHHSISDIINYMVKYNVISINIDEIINGTKNQRKFYICILNCIFGWLTFFITLLLFMSNRLINLLNNPMILPFNQIKQIIFLISTVLFLISVFKTDLLIQEKRNNLSEFKFIYYLIVNNKSKHKLNKLNYELFHLISTFFHIFFIKLGHPIVLSYSISTFIIILIIAKSWFLFLMSPIIIYSLFAFFTSTNSILSIIYLILIYFYMRFKQINNQIRIFGKMNKISPEIFIKLIKEHNEVSLAISKMNLFMNRTIAAFFIVAAFSVDLVLYLFIYTNSLFYKFIFFICFLSGFGVILIINILLIKISNSAHQSHNKIYSMICKRRLSYRIKYKVINQ